MALIMNIWKQIPPLKIPGTAFTLRGSSWAARNTCFYIQEMDVMLDAGLEHEYIPEHLFITHGHSDHSKNIPQAIVQLSNIKSQNQKKVNIYVPKEIHEYVYKYIDAFYIMSKNNPKHKAHGKYNLIPVEYNSRIEVIIRNIKYIVEIIKCFHSVPCVGYGFIQMRKKLKSEFKDLEGHEIAELRKSGIEVMNDVEYPMFCYLGDSNEYVFTNKETSEMLNKYPVIMSECTFITADQIEQAHKKRHIHIDGIHELITKTLDKTFILYHFSERYNEQEIIDFFISKNYPNVIPWVALDEKSKKLPLPWKHYL